jgi:2'-5' RNA ligase
MIRLFAAIAVPDAAAQALAALAQGLPGARWSPPENLHITLRFVGEVSEDVADDLDAGLGAVPGSPFDVSLAGVGSFGDGRRIEAIWVGVEASEALSQLQRRCESAARRAGLKADTRTWKPHVTLAYPRGSEGFRVGDWSRRHNLFRAPPFRVDRFGLYSSWRTRGGSAYRLERSYSLGG